MNWKKLSFFLLICLTINCCRQKESVDSPFLIFKPWKTDLKKVENFWKAVAAEKSLQKIFRQESLNNYFPRQSYQGTLRADGVTHQTMVVNGSQQYRLKIKIPKNTQMKFSVYAAQQSDLKFSVWLKFFSREKMLFFHKQKSGVSEIFSINLDNYAEKEVELILKSSGHGLGAWINPGNG